jgi:diacylglycerol kinase
VYPKRKDGVSVLLLHMAHPNGDKQSIFTSMRGASRGWTHAMTERNFRIILICGLIAISLMALFNGPGVGNIAVLVLVVVTLVAEIFNTAIEELADALIQEHHPGIAKVKELTAGAVFLLALTTFFVTVYYLYY